MLLPICQWLNIDQNRPINIDSQYICASLENKTCVLSFYVFFYLFYTFIYSKSIQYIFFLIFHLTFNETQKVSCVRKILCSKLFLSLIIRRPNIYNWAKVKYIIMEHQINTSDWLLKDRVTLKTGVMASEIQHCHHKNNLTYKLTVIDMQLSSVELLTYYLNNCLH